MYNFSVFYIDKFKNIRFLFDAKKNVLYYWLKVKVRKPGFDGQNRLPSEPGKPL